MSANSPTQRPAKGRQFSVETAAAALGLVVVTPRRALEAVGGVSEHCRGPRPPIADPRRLLAITRLVAALKVAARELRPRERHDRGGYPSARLVVA